MRHVVAVVAVTLAVMLAACRRDPSPAAAGVGGDLSRGSDAAAAPRAAAKQAADPPSAAAGVGGDLSRGSDAAPPWPKAACDGADCLPGFRVTTIDGTSLSTDDLRGRPVLVMFWASFCEPCITEGPSIEEVYRRHQGDGFVIVGLSRDEIDAPALRQFRDHYGFTYPIARTTPEVDAIFGNLDEIPVFLLYGRDGRRTLKMTGALPATILEEEVRRVLQERR